MTPNDIDDRDLGWALSSLLQLQGYSLNRVQLHTALGQLAGFDRVEAAHQLAQSLGINHLQIHTTPDPARLPLLAFLPDCGWGILQQRQANGLWSVLRPHGGMICPESSFTAQYLYISTDHAQAIDVLPKSFSSVLKASIQPHRSVLFEGVVATLAIGFLTLATSLFSMQVYDRVIPTGSVDTLVILASGVVLLIGLELILKFARSKVMDSMVVGIDHRLSREIFQRLLSIRIDHLPNSVGSLAAQVRAYEQVRSFYTANTIFTLAELPVALAFLLLIAMLGTPWLALAPAVAVVIALIIGAWSKHRVDVLAAQGITAANRKTGLLVETVEGIETIKSGVGGWRFLSRWVDVTQISIRNDLEMRHNNEALQYWVAAIQQLSYMALIVIGALSVINGDMTIGALIACSILSGRVLSPILTLPSLMVQRAHAKAAIVGLEALYALKTDNHAVTRPLIPVCLRGEYVLDQVSFAYPDAPAAFKVQHLQIKSGEKIAIIGPIGSGKSTLLKLLSGLYHPQQGRVLLDGLELQQIHQQTLAEQIGYLQQDHRLFQGSLRENLLIGLPDQGDQLLYDAMHRSGLIQLVSEHPRGLDLPISEGGKGLSGGQKQLVAFTRLLLNRPKILLLDEPTASMDSHQEQRCVKVLAEQITAGETLVVVTHKNSLLPLVDRVIVVSGHTVVMDGSRDQVLKQLRLPVAASATTPQTSAVTSAAPIISEGSA